MAKILHLCSERQWLTTLSMTSRMKRGVLQVLGMQELARPHEAIVISQSTSKINSKVHYRPRGINGVKKLVLI